MILKTDHPQTDLFPDRCPVCKRDLSGYTPEHKRKHIDRCRRSKPKYVYDPQEPEGLTRGLIPLLEHCLCSASIGVSNIYKAHPRSIDW